MGVKGVEKMTLAQARKAAIAAVEKLSADVGIPPDLKGVLKKEDVQFLAESAYADACRPGNPRDCTVEQIAKLYKSLM
jgi:lactaldehyde reductase